MLENRQRQSIICITKLYMETCLISVNAIMQNSLQGLQKVLAKICQASQSSFKVFYFRVGTAALLIQKEFIRSTGALFYAGAQLRAIRKTNSI